MALPLPAVALVALAPLREYLLLQTHAVALVVLVPMRWRAVALADLVALVALVRLVRCVASVCGERARAAVIREGKATATPSNLCPPL